MHWKHCLAHFSSLDIITLIQFCGATHEVHLVCYNKAETDIIAQFLNHAVASDVYHTIHIAELNQYYIEMNELNSLLRMVYSV